ncbi:MAG: hypothetical protein CMM67_00305 [Rhodospirillaceae bacterium]|nr:hypothetical protein [Rhodospirillaceae bacterium]OUT80778.1 MAG: hypothetical protein CBB83_00190 [Rhodospirillaceae bacterium TMED23]|tara:strand:+ start:469 stop:705 length:237 start_codon:yes stop_codon:yes gene_type:complete
MIDKLATLRKLLWFFVEFFSLVLVLIIFIYFLLGQSSGPFILDVIENIGLFVKAVGKNAIVAILIIISLVLYLNNRRS